MHPKNLTKPELQMSKNHKPQSKIGNLLPPRIAASLLPKIVLQLESLTKSFVTMLSLEECTQEPPSRRSFKEKRKSSCLWKLVVAPTKGPSSVRCTSVEK